jgi:hypothetical protein
LQFFDNNKTLHNLFNYYENNKINYSFIYFQKAYMLHYGRLDEDFHRIN